jgi:hypothetical protein
LFTLNGDVVILYFIKKSNIITMKQVIKTRTSGGHVVKVLVVPSDRTGVG